MGDPSKPDHLKPFCVFDDDDFYTIDQMKDALRELKATASATSTTMTP